MDRRAGRVLADRRRLAGRRGLDDGQTAFWWLVALRGLRRGEAAGLRWQDIDPERRQLTVVDQRTTVGYQIIEGPPKSAASRRTIALDDRTVAVLRAHRQLYGQGGLSWTEAGYVFRRCRGAAVPPGLLGLPPVRLHDLRHGAPAWRTPPTPTPPSYLPPSTKPPQPPPD